MLTAKVPKTVGQIFALLSAAMIACLMLLVDSSWAQTTTPINFGKSILGGEVSSHPTSLQFGPDGRLYVAEQEGSIKAYTVKRNGANAYAVTATETINLIKSIPNHNDDGTTNTSVTDRQVTGLLVAGTAQQPVIYVGSSDPRIGAGGSGTDLNLDTNSGVISRLSWNGTTWQKVDLVRGLPRSEENHSINGMQLSSDGNTLYVAAGGNTNQGAPSNNFALLPEFALSAAILKIDLANIGNTTYDLPTLAGTATPFGGNDGNNQAKLVSGGPVQVYAPGLRNAYDLVITQGGKMYTIDNGGNAGWGDVPKGEGPNGTCTNQQSEPGLTNLDQLHLIPAQGHYSGHPNPTRANKANTFGGLSPVEVSANPIECDYNKPGTALTTYPASTNGLDEYTASNFGGAMKGNLLAASFDNKVYRIQLNSAGDQVNSNAALFSSVGSNPLDVIAQGDNDPFPGTIWVADIYGNNGGTVFVFEPADFGGGGGTTCDTSNPNGDADSDGYTNQDELDSGTDPCSAADVPPDADNDKISDKTDPDDDNDGQPDTSDPFAVDANNGMSTSLPVRYNFDSSTNGSGLLNLGFTGLMTNGTSDYKSLYDPDNLTAGGAAGVLTVDQVSEGDAWTNQNNQENAFQFGTTTSSNSNLFTARTRVAAPFSGVTPQDFQSMGIFLGTGDQDNYIKLVTAAKGGQGGIEFAKETGGTFAQLAYPTVQMPGPDYVDLYLTVDLTAQTVQASYAVSTNGVVGSRTNVGLPQPVPATWLDGSKAVAVGIISTSFGSAPPFPATWDFIEVVPGNGTDPSSDTTPPETTITSGPTGTVNSSTANFAFTSSESGSTFQCSLDNAAFSACTSPKSYTNLADGAHTFSVKATDAAGNTDPTPATSGWTVSTGNSSSYALKVSTSSNRSSPTDLQGSTQKGNIYVFTSPDTSNISKVDFYLDDPNMTGSPKRTETVAPYDYAGGSATVANPFDTTTVSDGSHQITAKISFNDGTAAKTVSSSFTVSNSTSSPDTTPPQTTITSGPTGTVNTSTATFAFTSSESGSTFQCSLDNAAYSPCTSPKSYSNLADGAHTFSVKATDAAGNTDATPATSSWTVSTGNSSSYALKVSTNSTRSGAVDLQGSTQKGNIYVFTSPDTSNIKQVDFYLDDPNMTGKPKIIERTAPYDFAGGSTTAAKAFDTTTVSDGSHQITAKISFKDGTAAKTVNSSFTVNNGTSQDTTPPETTITSGPTGTVNTSTATFAFTSSESGSTFQCSLDNAAYSSCTSPKSYSSLADGAHTFSVKATDAAGNTDPTPATSSWTVATTSSSTGQWSTLTSSSQNRQEVSYVEADGKFYLAGGGTLHERYDPVANSWSTVKSLPANLDHIQGVEVNGLIYYIGGLSSWPGPHASTVYVYDPKTDTFSEGTPMPSGRGRGAGGVAVHNGKIYYAGGLHDGKAVPWFDVYDPATKTWSTLPDMPRARDHFQAAVVDGKFYAISGRDTAIDATTDKVDVYDLASGTGGSWQTPATALPTPRGGFATGVLGKEILVIGGEGGGKTYNTVEAYDTANNSWRTLAPMPTARHGIQAAECNGGLYVAAGGKTQGGGSPTNVHEVFFLNGSTKCESSTPPPPSSTYGLKVSTSSTRSGAVDLEGTTQKGNIYVFTSPDTSNISKVDFYLDNPNMTGAPNRTETVAPYDYAGGSTTVANPFNTTTVSNGSHQITTKITFSDGTTKVVNATFTVSN